MTLYKDYLAQKAKFFSPQPGGTMTSSSEVSNVESDALDNEWMPTSGRRDPGMIDALLKTLDDYLGDRLPPVTEETLNQKFQPLIDEDDDFWQVNTNEAEARWLVGTGAIRALRYIMKKEGYPFDVLQDTTAPGFGSKVDFTIVTGGGKKLLVEIKAPNVLNAALPTVERPAAQLRLRSGAPSQERVLIKACLYMASHKANWLALTSHDKWVFLRLHNKARDPYITYSTVEQQADNTRPFRALLAMMLAVQFDLKVESNADLTVPLPPIKEEHETENDAEVPDRDKSGPYKGKGGPTREERPVTRPRPPKANQSVAAPSLLVSWAEKESRTTKWRAYRAVDGTEKCSSLGAKPIKLRLQRFLGRGSTGRVFEAKHDVDGCSEALQSRSYAFKTVEKGKYEEEEGQIQRLYREFSIYCNIEQVRRNGKICNAAPRCYGLYETQWTLVLVLDYEGESLGEAEWASLQYQQRSEIFNAIRELHEIGIGHYDLEPRNVVRDAKGRYKIIDFSSGAMHRCLGMKQISGSSNYEYGDDECGELKVMWWELMRQQPFQIVGKAK